MKDKGSNLNVIGITSTNAMNCELLDLKQLYVSSCFKHVMSKMCQYVATKFNKTCHVNKQIKSS
jgi:beta-glucosidase-like glycosyl hydrolase